jgi:plasmid stabilization system protein ParE
MPIQWTQRARRQFLAIIDALLEDNPAAAERAYDAITDSVSRLLTFPEMGRRAYPGPESSSSPRSRISSPIVFGGKP